MRVRHRLSAGDSRSGEVKDYVEAVKVLDPNANALGARAQRREAHSEYQGARGENAGSRSIVGLASRALKSCRFLRTSRSSFRRWRRRLPAISCSGDFVPNKGTAFTEPERDEFELHGLLPSRVASLDEQVSRRLQALRGFSTDLERLRLLTRASGHQRNGVLRAADTQHRRALADRLHTTVGAGCQHFSRLFRKPRGLFLSLQS